MHIRRLAPLLSATFNMVRSWIMSSPLFGAGAFDDAHQHPRFTPRHRPARLDGHRVAFLALIALVMREELRGAANVLAVGRMFHQTLDGHRNGLVHLVADHLAREQPLPGNGSRARRRFGRLYFGRHYDFLMRFAQPSTGSKRPRPTALAARALIIYAPAGRARFSHAQCSYAPSQI